jgi:hypothetical protein
MRVALLTTIELIGVTTFVVAIVVWSEWLAK